MKQVELLPPFVPDELYQEWGYPELDPKFKDPEWHKKQLELDSTDPRHNPNLKREQTDPEFWYEAARKPFHKAILRTEQHWNKRRQLWMRQYEIVADGNRKRELITDLLEESTGEVKKLLAPILKYRITMAVLGNMLERAKEHGQHFLDLVEDETNLQSLRGLRRKLDEGGDEAAAALLAEFDDNTRRLADRASASRPGRVPKERQIADVSTLANVINWGTKCKKDGIIEWEKGNWLEAQAAWRQGDDLLMRFKGEDESDSKILFDLHRNVLKNLAQACLKLENWTEALAAATAAVELGPDDHKAWFRKACALEGLGRLDEAEECLRKVEDCSVDRPDRERITKDAKARGAKIQALKEAEQAALKQAVTKALEKGVFAEDREPEVIDLEPAKALEESTETLKRPKVPELVLEATTKHLTREGAQDLLTDLRDALQDRGYQLQALKLARDVKGDKAAFLANIKAVALPFQRPILERWGFEPTAQGAREMSRAVQEFTSGPRADPVVKQRADETTMAMFGVMYDVLTRPDSGSNGNHDLDPRRIAQVTLSSHLGRSDEE